MKSPNRYDRALMVLAQGGVFSPQQICDAMNYKAVYRVSAVILDAKIFAGAVIKPQKQGRKVIGYELVNVDEMNQYLQKNGFTSFTPAKPSVSAKAQKITKTSTPASVKTEVKKVASAPVDVLDEIDTDITDFEDREFVKGVVDGTL